MVNPIVSGLSATAINPIASEPGRPAAIPDVSQQVTATMSSTNSNGSTQGDNPLKNGSQSTLERAITHANNNLQAWSTGMEFKVDPDSNRVVISITDSKTGEVLRTIPTDAVLRVAKMITKLQEKSIDTKA